MGKRKNQKSLAWIVKKEDCAKKHWEEGDRGDFCPYRPNSWVLLAGHRSVCSEDWPGVVGKVSTQTCCLNKNGEREIIT